MLGTKLKKDVRRATIWPAAPRRFPWKVLPLEPAARRSYFGIAAPREACHLPSGS